MTRAQPDIEKYMLNFLLGTSCWRACGLQPFHAFASTVSEPTSIKCQGERGLFPTREQDVDSRVWLEQRLCLWANSSRRIRVQQMQFATIGSLSNTMSRTSLECFSDLLQKTTFARFWRPWTISVHEVTLTGLVFIKTSQFFYCALTFEEFGMVFFCTLMVEELACGTTPPVEPDQARQSCQSTFALQMVSYTSS